MDYAMVGKTLELLQKWEVEFKKVTIFYNIEKSDDKRSLSNMNSFLLRNKVINDEQYNLIKSIIEMRNMIIHRMFVDYANNYEAIEKLLFNINNAIHDSFNLFESLI